ncbi:MAG: flagellar hook assembly protein FlgD [Wolinella sp.]
MAVVTNTNNTSTLASSKDVVKNKKSELDKDAFLKLFLEELKAQDPTSPMETEKILEQTAMMTQIEQQEEMKKTLASMTDTIKTMAETSKKLTDLQGTMKTTLENLGKSIDTTNNTTNFLAQLSGYNTVGMIGKIAETDVTGLNIKNNDPVKFDLYFDEAIDTSKGNPVIRVLNEKNEVVNEFSLSGHNGVKGYATFEWDTKNSAGANVPAGAYRIVAEYNLDPATNRYKETRIGRGEVQSVIYEKNVPYLKLGNNLALPLGNVKQLYAKG